MKPLKIALCGTPWDYKDSLIPKVIETFFSEIEWVLPNRAELIILGPFECPLLEAKKNWKPKLLRKSEEKKIKLDSLSAVSLFHTSENLRTDYVGADFSISFDLTPHNKNNLRFPYWMEFIDWSSDGILGQENPRYGKLISQDQLLVPLPKEIDLRKKRAAFFTSHLLEPRKGIYELTSQFIPVDGYGMAFDKSIKDHASSGVKKLDILRDYVFNLCPENSMHPGYNTEKIPEAFAAGCIPITWTVPRNNIDFNYKAYLNLSEDSDRDLLNDFSDRLNERSHARFFEQPLLRTRVSIQPLVEFLRRVVTEARA